MGRVVGRDRLDEALFVVWTYCDQDLVRRELGKGVTKRQADVGLSRQSISVDTPYGKIRAKLARRPGGSITSHAEYDDLKRAANKAGVSLEEVLEAVRGRLGNQGEGDC